MRSLTMLLDSLFMPLEAPWRVALILLFLLLMAVLARARRLLSSSGVAMAFLLGFIVFYIGGVSGMTLFVFFFLSASAVTRLVGEVPRVGRKGSQRDWVQVLANGLPATFALVLSRLSPWPGTAFVAFAAALAEAEADCLGGSIGLLSHQDPVSVVTFTKVPRGISGGVTCLGLAASLAASSLIALLFAGTFGSSLQGFLVISGTGFLGSLLDSFLGATVQAQYRRKDGELTEREKDEDGNSNESVRGIPWMDNDMVNLLSGLFSLFSALALASI